MDEFYIHLYSEFNKDKFPDNKHNSFTNVISPEILLDGDFEVGVSNIIFEPHLYTIKKDDANFAILFNIEFGTEKEIKYNNRLRYVPTEDIYANNILVLLKKFDKDLVSYLKHKNVIQKLQTSILEYHNVDEIPIFKKLEVENTTKFEHRRVIWQLSIGTALLMGVSQDFVDEPKFQFIPNFSTRSDFLNVYCDIVQPSYVGQQLVNILDVIPLSHMYSKTIMMNLYKRVSQNRIRDISIKINDETGRSATFPDSVKMYIILHFRKIV